MTDAPSAGTAHPGPAHPPLAPRMLAAVFVGGALGTLARVGLGELLQRTAGPDLAGIGQASSFFTDPVLQATLIANLVGTLVLGLVSGAHVAPRIAWLRAALGPGFCGGFTTFSYVMLALAASGLATAWGWALLVGGVLGGLLFAWVGLVIGAALFPVPRLAPPEAEEREDES